MTEPRSTRRPPELRRTWLFVAGADPDAHRAALAARPDVLIADLEDFTPPPLRPRGREMAVWLMDACRRQGIVAGVRVNPLEGDGEADLAVVMHGRPDVVLLPKTVSRDQVVRLDQEIALAEERLGLARGGTEIVPNVESAAGLVQTLVIAKSSPRVTACLVAAEDMAADLGVERSSEGVELQHVRERFLVDCRAAGVVAIDCPYTFADAEGARAEAEWARTRGFVAKSAVSPDHVGVISAVLTPDPKRVAHARIVIAAFEAARAAGRDRVEVDGALVEVPTYLTAVRLLARHESLERFEHARGGPTADL